MDKPNQSYTTVGARLAAPTGLVWRSKPRPYADVEWFIVLPIRSDLTGNVI